MADTTVEHYSDFDQAIVNQSKAVVSDLNKSRPVARNTNVDDTHDDPRVEKENKDYTRSVFAEESIPFHEESLDDSRWSADPKVPKTRNYDTAQRESSESENSGTNLFVTGIAPRIQDEDLIEMFSKYGTIMRANILKDPATKEPRGFGFVSLSTVEEADAAIQGLNTKEFFGRVLNVQKARRSRPRSPTPGKYMGSTRKGMMHERMGSHPYNGNNRMPSRYRPNRDGRGSPNYYRPSSNRDYDDNRSRFLESERPRRYKNDYKFRPYGDRRRKHEYPRDGQDQSSRSYNNDRLQQERSFSTSAPQVSFSEERRPMEQNTI
ncbi:RNA-binding protein involved in histone acetylation [Schizosaccharomyces osmophilus]|uniref:RNA-binding protein involved in histone acetylation n=1 Tax=Schizosaccharomyces osmophilus TaxID=2545709 RepID=A0AAE9WD96_9SCHI|nr:RNA-binding protein involved in histone acetylation [Schizosaccharomyces osmophilus]WBW74231.1 RNA-binding protein involved in histone acetylation [Schizosaccharomyces osmophilus]